MFRKTLVQLTLINSILMILITSLLGGTIYFYESSVTFRDSDALLQKSFQGPGLRLRQPLGPEDPGHRDPRLSWVIFDKKKNILFSSWGDLLTKQQTSDYFKPLMIEKTGTITEKTVGGNYYHVLAKSVSIKGTSLYINYSVNVNPEKNLLRTLLAIILYGLLIGAVLAVAAGYFLARRALRPIRKAWDKQSRFVADASHELRTPLSIIQLKIEGLLKQPRRRIKEIGEDIAVMLDETRRLSKLVGNLLTLARSDANRLEVELKPMDLKAIVSKVAEPFIEMAEFKEKTFTLEAGAEPVMIMADKQRIHQLLVILFDNAMKFTSEHGTITVSCSKEGKNAVVTVSDSGIGISAQDLPHVFDRFFQSDLSRTDQRGTGLGLSIAHWIVQKHHGRIDVVSRLHEGTTFTIHLPLLKQ